MQTIIKMVLLALIISLFFISAQVIAEAPTYEEELPNIKVYAFEQVLNRWGSDQWDSFDKIVSLESLNWTVMDAHYPTGYTKDGIKSSAFGLCGFLDGTWAGTGYEKTEDPYIQISACVEYIEDRHKTPDKAWEFHLKNNYY